MMMAEKQAPRTKAKMKESETAETHEAFSWEEWIEEGMRGLRQVAADLGVPEEFLEHSCAAHREVRLAGKSLLRSFAGGVRDLGQKVAGSKEEPSRQVERIQVQ